MKTSVITIARGRHSHWRRQRAALTAASAAAAANSVAASTAAESTAADHHVLVAMADDAFVDDGARPPLEIVRIDADPRQLPLARARNVGAATAIERGAELLIFLDVDCIPSPDLVRGYCEAARAPESRDALLCGPVTYLAAPGPGGYDLATLHTLDHPHPARPAPEPGAIVTGGQHELFWSLSFAVEVETWNRVGGFDERYIGYGGEDTDFGCRARAAGVDLAWVGSARAYHQYHPVADPPIAHLEDILRNGRIYADRWGTWPMRGWLEEFVRLGLVERDDAGNYRRLRSSRGVMSTLGT